MAINFEAANMAGYNNPEIEIVTFLLGGAGDTEPRTTYETISTIHKRGAIPFLSIPDPSGGAGQLLPISYYNSTLGVITFSVITQTGAAESDTMSFVSVKFIHGASAPILKLLSFSPNNI